MQTRRPLLETVAWLVGTGLLLATGGIHLDLYLTGYRSIPTIGWLFLVQVIAAFVLAAAVVILRRPFVAAFGAVFALATLGGYLLSIWAGLFGFKEVRTTAGIVAGAVEVIGFAVLGALVVRSAATGASGERRAAYVAPRWLRRASTLGTSSVAALSVAAAVLLGLAVSSAGSAAAGPGTSTAGGGAGSIELQARTIGGKVVLTNSKGFTLYWFALDTSKASHCYGTCAAYWPPVLGRPVAGSGVSGRLGTIKRTGGQLQATFDGHPLYTYVGDSAPGQAHGNGLNLNGGLWYEVKASGG